MRTTNRVHLLKLQAEHFENNRQRMYDGTADMDFDKCFVDPQIGDGVFSKAYYSPKAELLAYRGVDLSYEEGLAAEMNASETGHSYIFSYEWEGKKRWIDATKDHPTDLGRIVNHSHRNPNAKAVPVKYKDGLMIVFQAIKPISPGEEIRYDYNENRKEVLDDNPWLKNS